MANEALPEVDPAKSYRVVLSRSVQIVDGVWARPSDHDVIISGADVVRFGAAVESYEEV